MTSVRIVEFEAGAAGWEFGTKLPGGDGGIGMAEASGELISEIFCSRVSASVSDVLMGDRVRAEGHVRLLWPVSLQTLHFRDIVAERGFFGGEERPVEPEKINRWSEVQAK